MNYCEGQRGRRVGGETRQAQAHRQQQMHMCTFIFGSQILANFGKFHFSITKVQLSC